MNSFQELEFAFLLEDDELLESNYLSAAVGLRCGFGTGRLDPHRHRVGPGKSALGGGGF
jgi:hypothetical protein